MSGRHQIKSSESDKLRSSFENAKEEEKEDKELEGNSELPMELEGVLKTYKVNKKNEIDESSHVYDHEDRSCTAKVWK